MIKFEQFWSCDALSLRVNLVSEGVLGRATIGPLVSPQAQIFCILVQNEAIAVHVVCVQNSIFLHVCPIESLSGNSHALLSVFFIGLHLR